jgi:hypothetical protein
VVAWATPALASPGVEPAAVNRNANPGTSFDVDKTVHTPEIPPKPDIVLLVDTTGSMGGAIANVRTNLHTIVTDVRSAQPTAEFAVASYRDEGDGAELFTVRQQMTAVEADVQTAVDGLAAGGGGDGPEAWVNALYEVSTGAITYRPDSSRIVVLVGDAPSHDPSNGHTLADAITALNTKKTKVVAVAVSGGLDAFGQATAVVNGTGGELVNGTPSDVTTAILKGLKSLDVTVEPHVVSCDAGLSLSFNPADATVPSGTDAHFVETVTVAAGAAQGATLVCKVEFWLNGAPAGDAFAQTVTVHVNDVTPPVARCAPGPNPGGNVPPPSEAGFYTLVATDNVDPAPAIYIKDTGDASVNFGPFKSGNTIKLTQAPGATPQYGPGTGAVDYKVRLRGDALLAAVDAAGNKSAPVKCLVPPPPK